MKRKACPACGHKDCEGWQPGQPQHEYRKGNWFLGCHCPNCMKSRDEAGGFIALLQSEVKGGAA